MPSACCCIFYWCCLLAAGSPETTVTDHLNTETFRLLWSSWPQNKLNKLRSRAHDSDAPSAHTHTCTQCTLSVFCKHTLFKALEVEQTWIMVIKSQDMDFFGSLFVCRVLSWRPPGGLPQYKLHATLSVHCIYSLESVHPHTHTLTLRPLHLHLSLSLSFPLPVPTGEPDLERPLPGWVQGHSEDDWEGYSGHRLGSVHEVGTKCQAQMEI